MPEIQLCPNCERAVHLGWQQRMRITEQVAWLVELATASCPGCEMHLVAIARTPRDQPSPVREDWELLRPRPRPRRAPREVTALFSTDYEEAAAVLPVSRKASAALSRRLLQHIIREKAGITRNTLNAEVDALIERGDLPTDLANDLHALRSIGNFAAHPTKDTNTGEVVEVEEGEAEWCLDLLDELMDFYFVRPAVRTARRDAINARLESAGKEPI
jgi:Domain of unknown function (DUF4145)